MSKHPAQDHNAMWGTYGSLTSRVGSHLMFCRDCTAEVECPELQSLRARRDAHEDRLRMRQREPKKLQAPQIDSILEGLRDA